MNYKAIIFDMDGVLIDSMTHWLDIDREFFQQFGIELTNEMIKYLTGRSDKENSNWIKEQYKLDISVEDFLVKRNVFTDKIYTEKCLPMPGVEELFSKIKEKKLKQAIATGAHSSQAEEIVRRFGWKDYLDKIVAVDHVDHVGKPDPKIFLHTAKVLEINPIDCVVIEDAENGVTAAKAAGMKCVAVPDSRWSFGDFSQADLIVDSLLDKKLYNFLELE